MSRFIIVQDADDYGYCGDQLIDTDDNSVVMTDSWVTDAPEDATLARGYRVLVDIMNELDARLKGTEE